MVIFRSSRESVYPTYAERAYHRETCQPKKEWTILQGILDNGTMEISAKGNL